VYGRGVAAVRGADLPAHDSARAQRHRHGRQRAQQRRRLRADRFQHAWVPGRVQARREQHRRHQGGRARALRREQPARPVDSTVAGQRRPAVAESGHRGAQRAQHGRPRVVQRAVGRQPEHRGGEDQEQRQHRCARRSSRLFCQGLHRRRRTRNVHRVGHQEHRRRRDRRVHRAVDPAAIGPLLHHRANTALPSADEPGRRRNDRVEQHRAVELRPLHLGHGLAGVARDQLDDGRQPVLRANQRVHHGLADQPGVPHLHRQPLGHARPRRDAANPAHVRVRGRGFRGSRFNGQSRRARQLHDGSVRRRCESPGPRTGPWAAPRSRSD